MLLPSVKRTEIKTFNFQNLNSSVAENCVSFTCHLKRGGLDFQEEDTFELVQFVGYFRKFGDLCSYRCAC
jgi:hypothetical protein